PQSAVLCLFGIVVDAVPATKYCLSRHTICEADARRPILVIRIDELESRLGRVQGYEQVLLRVQFGGVAVDRVWHSGQLIADAVVEGQFAGNLPFVEDEKSIPPFRNHTARLSQGSNQALR